LTIIGIGLGHWRLIIFSCIVTWHLVLDIFCFWSVRRNYIDFWNNRQSAVKIFLRFAYSLVSIRLCQYYWRCNSYSNYERSVANKKYPHIFLVRTVNVPRFAYMHGEYVFKRRAQCSTNNVGCRFYLAPILLALLFATVTAGAGPGR
jgi:hypothetical protein